MSIHHHRSQRCEHEAPGPTRRPLRIGLSARVMHSSPHELGFKGKPLQYLESSIAHWIMEHGALTVMVPVIDATAPGEGRRVAVRDYVAQLDGLVLQGGADVAPQTYGCQPLKPQWAGDAIRDRYELALLHEFIHQGKPVVGVCRGAQLLNVYFGGTLYQDLLTQRADTHRHVDAELHDELVHDITFTPGSKLAALYKDIHQASVNSLHHQAVDTLGEGLEIEATSAVDGVVEAIRWTGPGYARGLQWHPEFHSRRDHLLSSAPVMLDFLHAAQARVEQTDAAAMRFSQTTTAPAST
jgi:putative glutamine amidotransferase